MRESEKKDQRQKKAYSGYRRDGVAVTREDWKAYTTLGGEWGSDKQKHGRCRIGKRNASWMSRSKDGA